MWPVPPKSGLFGGLTAKGGLMTNYAGCILR